MNICDRDSLKHKTGHVVRDSLKDCAASENSFTAHLRNQQNQIASLASIRAFSSMQIVHLTHLLKFSGLSSPARSASIASRYDEILMMIDDDLDDI